MSEIILSPAQQLISPYFLTPFQKVRQQPYPPIVKCLANLTDPPDLTTNPYWQSEIGHSVLGCRRFVAAEFLRITFDKRVNNFELRKQDSKQFKDQMRLEAKLWKACWILISLMHTHMTMISQSPVQQTPAGTFLLLILDRQLVQFIF